MKKSFFQFPENMSTEARSAVRIATVIAAVHFLAVPYYLYLIFSGEPSTVAPFKALVAITVVLTVLFGISAVLSRRGKSTAGMILVLGILAVSYPPVSALLVSGLGLVLGLALMVVGPISAFQVLPRRSAWGMSVLTVVSGLVTLLLDIFGSATRPSLPGIAIQILAVAVMGMLIIWVVREFRKQSMQITMKVLVPPLIFIALIVTGLIAYNLVVSIQQFDKSELERLERMEEIANGQLYNMETLAMGLVTQTANSPEVQAAFAARDRELLTSLTLPTFEIVKNNFAVKQYQFILPPATSFLRLHNLKEFGDDLTTIRATLVEANTRKTAISGVEIGRNGLGVRGVVPVFYQGRHLGVLEAGIDIGPNFLETLKQEYGVDAQIILEKEAMQVATMIAPPDATGPTENLVLHASTLGTPFFASASNYRQALAGVPSVEHLNFKGREYAVYSAPLYDFSGKVIGVIDIVSDHTAVAQQQNAQIYLSIGALLITLLLISLTFSYFASRTLRPIGDLTATAVAIANGDLDKRAEVQSSDEIGTLATAFNRMTAQLRDFIGTLESRVTERTRNLELAAEVGRTVSQVRALDIMLKDAAELIRKQFDLYYVQVYLTDPSQTNLILQSGTGSVGEQLISRGHRLPLNPGSINGRAAIEKKSVVISDTTSSPTFRPNPLLPDTRSEMAVPLMIGDRVVGVLDMQSENAGSLSQDALPAFEALAGQLAIAIQNANYLAEAEQARAEVEKQAKRLSRVNWTEYLDAIHKPEEIGFVFEQNKVAPLTTDLETKNNALVSTIAVAGETLGNLVVEIEGQSPVARTNELINTVARQVAQQIENLRLLESAERFRFEAEQASRRLTREGWKEYTDANANTGLSYIYDLKEVRAQNNNGGHEVEDTGYTLPLKVRDGTVGKLVIQGLDAGDGESISLANSVAERLGAHIEGLRLSMQTEQALTQSEKLFEASRVLTQSADLQELTAKAADMLGIREINRALLATFNYNTQDNIESLDIVANWWNGTGHEVTAVGTHYPYDVIRAMSFFVSPTPIFFSDTHTDERVDATTMKLVERLNLRAVAVLPLYTGTRQIGALTLEAEEPHDFTQEETRLFTALAPQISTMLENRRQFERAQQQAERESTLNVISQKIQSATTVEAVLQIAARELGHALGAPMTIAQLSMKDKK